MSKKRIVINDIFSVESPVDESPLCDNQKASFIFDKIYDKIKWPTSGYYDGDCFYQYDLPEGTGEFITVSLTDILQPNVDRSYFLSARACEGIIARSKNRKKPLCENLKKILETHMAEMRNNEKNKL